MGFLSRMFEARSLENPNTPIDAGSLAEVGGLSTATGVAVSANGAMRASAVYACVRVIAETIASLPLGVYQHAGDHKQSASSRPEYRLLHDAPNPAMTAFIWREVLQTHALLHGNAYAEIEWKNNGLPHALWPIDPSRVTPRLLPTGDKVYDVRVAAGSVTINDADMLHIPGPGWDGLRGFSPIALHRQSVGLSLAMEEFGARLFSNGLKPGAVLSHPKSLSDAASQRLQQQLTGRSGLANAHRTLVLEEDMKLTPWAMNPEDAQYLESRKFQLAEIARIYRVPLHMVGDLEHATFSNIEHQSLEFVRDTIRPWLVRWEQEINRKLFADGGFFCEHNVDAILRGDIKSRYEAYAIGRNWGWLSANDICRMENQNPIANGNTYLEPLNMIPAGSERQPTTTGTP